MPIRPQNPHLAHLHAALDAELAWEREEHARLLRLSLPDRIAAGVTWPPLRLASPPVTGPGWVRLSLRAAARGALDLHDGITPGDLVRIAPIASPDAAGALEGRCTQVDGPEAEIRLSSTDPLPGWLEGGHVAVTRAIDETTARRYQQGLLAADRHTSPLCTALLEPAPAASAPPRRRPPPALVGVNAAQQRAGQAALSAEALALIHGPPGTGKTTLMVALLQALVADGERPLALADSNAAVDHLALRAAEAGLSVLRLGSAWRVGAAARHLTLDSRIAAGPLAHPIRLLEDELRRADRREQRALLKEIRALRQQARDQIIADSQIIAVTLGTLVREVGSLPAARTALVDEATQAIEPAIWSVVPHVERLILLGDPEQLGPVVAQPGSPLERSLLQRLIAAGVAAPMLEEQHRMSADLLSLVAGVYGPAYRPHPAVADRSLRDLPGVATPPLDGASVVWVDTAGGGLGEARDPVTLSLYNDGEIDLIALAVQEILDAGVPAEDLGVIAPYSAQVARLRARLPGVEVNTVNAFQGREKEVILCSWVRSNPDGELGFVADGRRLTVAVTRARRLLVCVGDSATLACSERFAELVERVQALSGAAWLTVWEPPWDSALPA